jgi:hypothetical protein
MKQDLVKGGMYGALAGSVKGTVANALTAAGTTQTDALQLAADINVVATAAAATGVKLPQMEVPDTCVVHNLGANAVLVYPGVVGGVINALAANAGFSVPVGKQAVLTKVAEPSTFIAKVSA